MDKVMCHNSINRNNCLYADDTVNLIHWEHASFGDPAFDFGQILSEYDLDSPAIDEILSAYLGRPGERRRGHRQKNAGLLPHSTAGFGLRPAAV